jgi:hypothetical protein
MQKRWVVCVIFQVFALGIRCIFEPHLHTAVVEITFCYQCLILRL